MSWWDRLLARKSAGTVSDWPWQLLNAPTKSGADVNYKTALEVTTVLAAARVRAEDVAQVPLHLYRRLPAGGAEVAYDHPLDDLLYVRPNSWQTAFEFRETLALHLTLCGNAYTYINRVGSDRRIYELIQIEPHRVEVIRAADSTLTYRVTGDDGRQKTFPAEDIWHVRGLSWNGWMGLEAVKLAREAVGLAMQLEEAHARLHKNGVQPAGVYAVEGVLNDDQHKMITNWLRKHAGGENRGGPLVLDRAAKWLSQQMTGVDAQHLETRRFQIEEICRALRVMPIMVGYADKTATYASAEQMFLAHVVYTLQPLAIRLEQSIAVSLLTGAERRQGLYAKHNLTALLRGASKDRAEYFKSALGAGGSRPWMTQDEVRGLEELNPMGGDAGRLLAPPTAQPGPAPKPSEDDPPTPDPEDD